jgi:PAS domain S-box-containing protein
LREDERELRLITDAIPQTIVVLDPSGGPIYANRAVLDYTGLTAKDVVAPNFREQIFHPDDLDSLRDERKAALSRGLPFEVEQRALRKDGQYRWFLIRYNPLLDERGNVIRWYTTGTASSIVSSLKINFDKKSANCCKSWIFFLSMSLS